MKPLIMQEWVRADQERFRSLERQAPRTTLCLWQAGNQQHAACTERINRMWAAKHGYEVHVVESGAIDLEGRAPYWGKLKAIQACMVQEGQYVMYMDADAFVAHQEQDLESVLFPDIDFHVEDHGNREGKFANVNTGVLILKNTAWSRAFLQHWWDDASQSELLSEPFWEQTTLQYILQENLHESRQRTMVYPAYVFNTDLDPGSQDAAKSFIVHMMTATKEERVAQCSRFLEQLIDKERTSGQRSWAKAGQVPKQRGRREHHCAHEASKAGREACHRAHLAFREHTMA